MHKKLIINVAEHETRVALLENGTIVELFIDRGDDSNIAGNIYKGRVQRVLPGMQAAFVDIGLNQAAFIYVDDVICNDYKEFEQIFIKNREDDPEISGTGTANHTSSPIERDIRHIEELITEGQEIMIQVSKSAIGTKGPRVTNYISLPGRFLVLMPTSDHIGISRCIESETERERLKNIVLSLKKESYGYIVRTVSEGIYEEKLEKEMGFLDNLWKSIQRRYKSAPSPSL